MEGRVIALIVLGYVAILLILSTLEQYLSFFAFIPIAFAAYGLVQSAISFLLQQLGATQMILDAVSLTLTFAVIIGVDILRDNYEWLRGRIKPFTDGVFLRIFRKKRGIS